MDATTPNAPPKRPLTPKQHATYGALAAYIARAGRPPTLRELGAEMHLSYGTIGEHFKALADKGWIVRAPNRPGITLVETCQACGQPIAGKAT